MDPVRALIARASDPILHRVFLAHIEAYEQLQADIRDDLATRIANATWGEP